VRFAQSGPSGAGAHVTVTSGTTDPSAKTLASGPTGTVQANGKLAVNGSIVAVTVTGNNATQNNTGTVDPTGTGRAIRDTTGVTGLVINNFAGGIIQAMDATVSGRASTASSTTMARFSPRTRPIWAMTASAPRTTLAS